LNARTRTTGELRELKSVLTDLPASAAAAAAAAAAVGELGPKRPRVHYAPKPKRRRDKTRSVERRYYDKTPFHYCP